MTSPISYSLPNFEFTSLPKPSRKIVKSIFKKMNSFDWLSKKIKENVLNTLPESHRNLVVSYLEESSFIDRALEIGASDVVSILLGAGYHAKNCEVRAHAKIEDPFLVKQLMEQKVSFDMEFFHVKCQSFPEQTCWKDLLCSALNNYPSTQYNYLDLFKLIELAQTHENLKKLLTDLLQKWAQQDLEGLVNQIPLKRCSDEKSLKLLIDFWALGNFPQSAFESLLLDPDFLYWHSYDESISEFLSQENRWKAFSSTTRHYIEDCNSDILLGLFVTSLLHTTQLEPARSLLNDRFFISSIYKIPQKTRQAILNYIELLEQKEELKIWECNFCNEPNYIYCLKKLGMNFEKSISKTQCTILFTPYAYQLNYRELEFLTPHIFQQRNNDGNNALEHHCQASLHYHTTDNIKTCLKLGLILSSSFPHFAICQSSFPKNSYFQAILAIILLHPHRKEICQLKIEEDDRTEFKQVVSQNSKLFTQIQLFFDPDKPNERWRDYFSPEAQDLLTQNIEAEVNCLMTSGFSRKAKFYLTLKRYETLQMLGSLFGKELIGIKDLSQIPNCPRASLALAALKHSSSINLSIIFKHIPRNELIQLIEYLFCNPTEMSSIIKLMKLSAIEISPKGLSKSNYSSIVYPFLKGIQKVEHLWKAREGNLYRSLQQIKYSERHAYPGESFAISNQMESQDGESFNFFHQNIQHTIRCKKLDKSLSDFIDESRTLAVFKAYSQIFETQFPQSLTGPFIVTKLPAAFTPFNIPTQKAYYIDRKITSSTSRSLFELEEKEYQQARLKYLHDGARLIRMGIAPMPVNEQLITLQSENFHTLLVDLFVRIFHSKTLTIGARSNEKHFFTHYLASLKEEGLNIEKATVIEPQNPFIFFGTGIRHSGGDLEMLCLMYHLSSLLLLDVLTYIARFKKVEQLDWQNEKHLTLLAHHLIEAYVHLCATYTQRPLKDWENFAKQSELDWTAAARQIAFWSNTSNKGYFASLASGKVPEVIYGPEVNVSVNTSTFKSTDREPLGMTDFEKVIYTLFIPIILNETES